MKAVDTMWLQSNVRNISLEKGTYLVRLTIGTNHTLERIVEVNDEIETRVEFAEERDDIRFSVGDVAFNEGSFIRSEFVVDDGESIHDTLKKTLPFKWRNWNFQGRIWLSASNDGRKISWKRMLHGMPVPYDKLQILELPLSREKSLFVSIPAEHELLVRERDNDLSRHTADHYKISISLSNSVAQTLLSLITRGDMISARTLFNVKDAENLLLKKKSDPIAAVVGGYYLLKTNELEYIHNWANNLANWFEWLPDGCIIHAWQMILNKEEQKDKIKERLVQAVKRGIPVFTEGLRLLYDGLTMLSYDYSRENNEVEMALNRVKIYMKAADMSKKYTTLVADKDFLVKLF